MPSEFAFGCIFDNYKVFISLNLKSYLTNKMCFISRSYKNMSFIRNT